MRVPVEMDLTSQKWSPVTTCGCVRVTQLDVSNSNEGAIEITCKIDPKNEIGRIHHIVSLRDPSGRAVPVLAVRANVLSLARVSPSLIAKDASGRWPDCLTVETGDPRTPVTVRVDSPYVSCNLEEEITGPKGVSHRYRLQIEEQLAEPTAVVFEIGSGERRQSLKVPLMVTNESRTPSLCSRSLVLVSGNADAPKDYLVRWASGVDPKRCSVQLLDRDADAPTVRVEPTLDGVRITKSKGKLYRSVRIAIRCDGTQDQITIVPVDDALLLGDS